MNVEIPDLDDLEFETTCGDCWGRGTERHTDISCIRCSGTGKVITSIGEKLETFLERRGYKRVKEA